MIEEELGNMSPDLSTIDAFRAKDADFSSRQSEVDTITAERKQASRHTSIVGRLSISIETWSLCIACGRGV